MNKQTEINDKKEDILRIGYLKTLGMIDWNEDSCVDRSPEPAVTRKAENRTWQEQRKIKIKWNNTNLI